MTPTAPSSDPTAQVLLERRGALGVMRLNRPRALNALTTEMVMTMTQGLDEWANDPAVETVAVVGAGERGLCAGGDVSVFYDDAVNGGSESLAFWRHEYRLNALIASYPKPYVAIMDGLVLGGGVGISAHGSHRVVSESTRVGMPETGIGFIPDVGGTWLLSRAPGELGTYLALSGMHVGPGDAIELGLADHFVPTSRTADLLRLLANTPADEAVAAMAVAPPAGMLAERRDEIDIAFAHDDVRHIVEALHVREGSAAAATRGALDSKSPTSLVATLRAVRSARTMSTIEEALGQEYRVAARLLRSHDLREGIRAQVIDKDRQPQWDPATLQAVSTSVVDELFAPLADELTFRERGYALPGPGRK